MRVLLSSAVTLALVLLTVATAFAAADTRPVRFNGGKLFLRPNGKVLIADGTANYDYDVAAGVIVPVLASRHVAWRHQQQPYILAWSETDRLALHCIDASTLADTGTFVIERDDSFEAIDGRFAIWKRRGKLRTIDLSRCEEIVRPTVVKSPPPTVSYSVVNESTYRLQLHAKGKKVRHIDVKPLETLVFRPTPENTAIAFERFAFVTGHRTLFVWDWSKGGAGTARETLITGLDWCHTCQLEFRDATTLVYGHGLIDVTTAKYTPRPDAEVRRVRLGARCDLVQDRATWKIVSIAGDCGQRALHDDVIWTATEHVAVRDADYHSPRSWGAQVYDLDRASLVFSTSPESGDRRLLARIKRDWQLVTRAGWLAMRAGATWIRPDQAFRQADEVVATDIGIFTRRSDEDSHGTTVALWLSDGTRGWEAEAPTRPKQPAVTLASGDRLLVGGGYASIRRRGDETTALSSCAAGSCVSAGASPPRIRDYEHPSVIEHTDNGWQVRDLESDRTTRLALDDCVAVLFVPGTKSYACATDKTIGKRTATGAKDGPEVPALGYPSMMMRAGKHVIAYGAAELGGDPEEVRRIDLASGDVVRVYTRGDGAIATYGDDSVEFFGDRAGLLPFVHCMRDGKIFVGNQQGACKLREVPGRFAK
jgi:hypothetical protein